MSFHFEDIPPNQTLYINNINEKIKKHDLKDALYGLFSEYGPVLEIIVRREMKMRGQAFVVFKDIETATTAMKGAQGFKLFDKPIRIAYSKSRSDVVAKMEGTYVPKKKRVAAMKTDQIDPRPVKRAAPSAPSASSASSSGPPPGHQNEPNNILFVTNLPPETTEDVLKDLFSSYAGFKEVQMIPGNSTVSFIEFDSDYQAGAAMQSLQDFRLTPDHAMRIIYAQR